MWNRRNFWKAGKKIAKNVWYGKHERYSSGFYGPRTGGLNQNAIIRGVTETLGPIVRVPAVAKAAAELVNTAQAYAKVQSTLTGAQYAYDSAKSVVNYTQGVPKPLQYSGRREDKSTALVPYTGPTKSDVTYALS